MTPGCNHSAPAQRPGLYIHVPFCRSKCPYCDFYSVASASRIPDWLEALREEIRHYSKRFRGFDTLYLGGGTPSMLDSSVLSTVLDALLGSFVFATDPEITLEANPGDLDEGKIADLRSLGIHRISLGIQSFEDAVLAFLGRRHTSKDARDAFHRLRNTGFENIGIDLIYGIPGQSLSGWIDTLKPAVALQPDHISCYQLTIDKGSVFSRLKEKGRIAPVGEDAELDFFMTTSEFLEDNGYLHYEISNFARSERRFSRHNVKYWRHAPYLGLGPSAHSHENSSRWRNVRSVAKYCRLLEARTPPIEEREDLDAWQLKLEAISLGLRTIFGFESDLVARDSPQHERLLEYARAGFLKLENNRVIPTRKGFSVADRLAVDLCV